MAYVFDTVARSKMLKQGSLFSQSALLVFLVRHFFFWFASARRCPVSYRGARAGDEDAAKTPPFQRGLQMRNA